MMPGRSSCDSCQYDCGAGQQHMGCGGSNPGGCAACDAGKSKAQAGSHACTECAKGTYHDDVGQKNCKDCSPGRYSDVWGATSCQACAETCPSGQFHLGCGGPSSGRCTGCLKGHFKEVASDEACTACETGKFQDALGKLWRRHHRLPRRPRVGQPLRLPNTLTKERRPGVEGNLQLEHIANDYDN